jgi:hypothetical protein
VKLPATVAFPTDDRLLQRIEASRRALPRNNMKALWRSRADAAELRPELRTRELDLQPPPRSDDAHASFERFQAARAELRSTLSQMEQLYPRGRVAV